MDLGLASIPVCCSGKALESAGLAGEAGEGGPAQCQRPWGQPQEGADAAVLA